MKIMNHTYRFLANKQVQANDRQDLSNKFYCNQNKKQIS